MKDRLSFIICTEAGALEQMSTMLVKSLRKFGGKFSPCEVHSFQPRAGHEISPETLNAFERLGVTHHSNLLNHEFPDYPLANKVHVCAYAEQHLNTELLVWLDSDKLILDEPSLLDLPPAYDIAARPIDKIHEGSDLNGDCNTPFWLQLYKELGVENARLIQTAVDGRMATECWNTPNTPAHANSAVCTFRKSC